jgi:hypothetical protein
MGLGQATIKRALGRHAHNAAAFLLLMIADVFFLGGLHQAAPSCMDLVRTCACFDARGNVLDTLLCFKNSL